jgi:hypothetical protein
MRTHAIDERRQFLHDTRGSDVSLDMPWTVGHTPPHTISIAASATSSAERSHCSDREFASRISVRVTGAAAGTVIWLDA